MGISKSMVVGWLTLAVGVLALPQFVALIPEARIPLALCIGGILTLMIRWLGGGLGANPLTAVGILTLAAGILEVPEFVHIIPLTWGPIITVISAVLTLATRYFAGQSTTDPAKPVNALMRTA